MYEEWMHSINLGGTAEVYYGFCPCMGQKPFFMLALSLAWKIRYTAMGSLLTDSCISNFPHMAKAMTEMERSEIEVGKAKAMTGMGRSEIEVGKAKAMTDAWILSEQSELSRRYAEQME